MKKCYKCLTNKEYKDFSKDKTTKDGFQSACKNCRNKQSSKYRKNNKKYFKIKRAEYYKSNKQEEIEYHKKYVEENKSSIQKYQKEYSKKYRSDNLSKLREKDKIYYKKYYPINKEEYRKRSRIRRARKQAVKESYTTKHEQITRQAFNNQCFNCPSIENLCIDHHRPLSKGHPLTLFNAVLLCRNCNSSKNNKSPEDFYGKKVCSKLDKKLKSIAKLNK